VNVLYLRSGRTSTGSQEERVSTIAMSPAHALHHPRRLDLRAVLGLFLLLASVTGSIVFWSTSSTTVNVVVATHDVSTGATLTTRDLAIARLRLDDAVYRAAIPASALTSVIGKQLSSPVYTDELLPRAAISTHHLLAPNQMLLAIPVSADTAVGGQIHPGDTVGVLLTTGRGTPAVRTSVVLPRVTIYDVGYEPGTSVVNTAGVGDATGAQTAIGWITLVVTEQQAVQLARARWTGQLDVALLPR
jgi:Flp pilus assembly protein CpaB